MKESRCLSWGFLCLIFSIMCPLQHAAVTEYMHPIYCTFINWQPDPGSNYMPPLFDTEIEQFISIFSHEPIDKNLTCTDFIKDGKIQALEGYKLMFSIKKSKFTGYPCTFYKDQIILKQVNALDITPDCQLLAAAGYQHIRMYDLNSSASNHIISYDGISKNVTSLGFQEDGKWMFTGGEDGTAKIWDLRSKNLHVSRIFKVDTPVNCVCLHPNQVDLFVGDQAGVIHIWDVNSTNNDNDPLVPESGASIQHLAIDPKGLFLAAINNKGKVYIWKLKGGTDDIPVTLTPIRSLVAHKKYGLKVRFSPDSSVMATTSADGKCTLWKTQDFTRILDFTEPNQRWVWDIAFSADSQFLITGSSDSTARLWSAATGKVTREYAGHRRAISAIAFRDKPLY